MNQEISLRDFIAAQAMNALIQKSNHEKYENFSSHAYEYADAMLAERVSNAEKMIFLLTYTNDDGSFIPFRTTRFVANENIGLAYLDYVANHWEQIDGCEVERDTNSVNVYTGDNHYNYSLEKLGEFKEEAFKIFLI